jgi:hypothetical protein
VIENNHKYKPPYTEVEVIVTDKQLITYAAIGILAYYVLNQKLGQQPLTKAQTVNQIRSAGGNVSYDSNGTFWQVPGGSVSLDQTFSPNLAQKILVGADRFIPGDWLTRKVYGV